jgi:nitrous oxide reductase accessory protein NosL
MIVGEHFGPNGQIFYESHSPDGHENPAWFHTLVQGLFPYYFAHRQRDWTAEVVYVTDYSTVDYELTTRDGETYISTHTAAASFERAPDVRYVAGSSIRGGMGTDLIPFSDDSDLEAFREEHGGDVVAFSDITPESINDYA